MKILITGARGMVGKNISEMLSKDEKFKLFLPTRKELDLLEYRSTVSYFKKVQPDLIIHCAGVVGGIHANIKYPVKFLTENTDIGRNVILGAKETGVQKLLNLASSCMYPREIENPLKEDYLLKNKLEPTNEGYALAKIYAAKLCDYIVKENSVFEYKTIIPCNLYGKWDKFNPEHSHMVAAIIKKTHEAKEENLSKVTIWGDGNARREFMYTEDLADFVKYAVSNFSDLPNLMNVGLGNDYTVNEYYNVVKEIVGYKGDFVYDLSKPVGMKQKLLDVSEQSKLGWKPKHSLEEGIKLTYEYYKSIL